MPITQKIVYHLDSKNDYNATTEHQLNLKADILNIFNKQTKKTVTLSVK